MGFKKMLSFVVILSLSLVSAAQTVDGIFSKYISFLGGERRLKQIHSIVDSGTYNYGGLEFPFVSYSKAPDLYKYVVTFKGKYFAQAFDGKDGWKIDVFKNEKEKTILHGKAATEMANEADVALEPPFIDYKKKGFTAVLDGVDTIEMRVCFRVKLFNTADTATYYFDKLNYSLVKKEAVAKNAELGRSVLETVYSDYRTVNGIQLPFRATSRIKDQTILTITLKKVELDVPVGEEMFKP